MKIGWFGYGGNQWLVEMHRDAIQSMDHELVTCHEYPNATVQYNKDTINQFIDCIGELNFTTRTGFGFIQQGPDFCR